MSAKPSSTVPSAPAKKGLGSRRNHAAKGTKVLPVGDGHSLPSAVCTEMLRHMELPWCHGRWLRLSSLHLMGD